ncbi:hypothetical protein GALL_549190 [mine drainage metagenome]|uniref:Uncharacterized protein n=1 Tax=mine drainage metagenome TaxID=410659 RepID=A0A1J5P7V5_9ZZZZ
MGRPASNQPQLGHGAHLRLRPDRADVQSARLRRHRRGHGGDALRHRRPRPPADACQPVAGRLDCGVARHHGRADGAASPRRHGRALERRHGRRGAGGGRGADRKRVQPDGKHADGIRRRWHGARADRHQHSRYRAVECLSQQGWRVGADFGQRRRDFQASDACHRPHRHGRGCRAGAQPRPHGARRRNRRGHTAMGCGTRARSHRAGHACGRGARHPHLQHCRCGGRCPVSLARHD